MEIEKVGVATEMTRYVRRIKITGTKIGKARLAELR